ncbi:MAG: pyruvate ferredoxin oxidoreductase [Candidatus Moranbacteria bacterium RBG_13_45_13]|nr:MAG: pyruvate ferredoxin oxidoreductase [Candidatus Moranbacteria bacterium RBG_13_45_13]
MIQEKNKNIALTGGAAAAEALKQINPDVMPVYPITPQTPIIETYAKMVADGEAATIMIEVESEHSAMSAAVGAQAAGVRAATASSSQGIMLMAEILPIASGSRLPVLMLVSARALSAPINIHGDHQDVMFVRDSGWIQIFSENAQEVYNNTFIALRLAEHVRLPAMVIMDGFQTSHSVENLEILEKAAARSFIGEYNPKKYLLDFENPVTFGPVGLPNSYFEFKRSQIEAMKEAGIEYENICADFAKISGREYGYFESYQLDDAEKAIVVAGSTAGTAKVAVDELREQGEKVGLLKIKLFRPFPYKQIAEALKNVKNIAVLDRTVSFGSMPPLYSEIIQSLYSILNTQYSIQPYIYGLGGREIFKEDIKKVFKEDWDNKEIKYIGLKENE